MSCQVPYPKLFRGTYIRDMRGHAIVAVDWLYASSGATVMVSHLTTMCRRCC